MSAPDGKWSACDKFEEKEMDLISREDAISWIECWLGLHKYYHPYSKCKTMPTSEVLDILNRVPSAEKTGEWIDSIEHDGWFCSKCGYQITSRYGKYNYCPNCGSQMVE